MPFSLRRWRARHHSTAIIRQGSASVMAIVVWPAGSPLLLLLLWLAVRPRAGEPELSVPPR